jgi:hypothetical protein
VRNLEATMKIFPNNSTAISLFGYFLFGAGILMWIVDFALYGVSNFPIHLGYGSIALTGLVATMAAKQLKNLEDRLEKIERSHSS